MGVVASGKGEPGNSVAPKNLITNYRFVLRGPEGAKVKCNDYREDPVVLCPRATMAASHFCCTARRRHLFPAVPCAEGGISSQFPAVSLCPRSHTIQLRLSACELQLSAVSSHHRRALSAPTQGAPCCLLGELCNLSHEHRRYLLPKLRGGSPLLWYPYHFRRQSHESKKTVAFLLVRSSVWTRMNSTLLYAPNATNPAATDVLVPKVRRSIALLPN